MVARSTPSSSAHRSSGAAIGRPTSGSCRSQVRMAGRVIERTIDDERLLPLWGRPAAQAAAGVPYERAAASFLPSSVELEGIARGSPAPQAYLKPSRHRNGVHRSEPPQGGGNDSTCTHGRDLKVRRLIELAALGWLPSQDQRGQRQDALGQQTVPSPLMDRIPCSEKEPMIGRSHAISATMASPGIASTTDGKATQQGPPL
jgi:hypothetical protein